MEFSDVRSMLISSVGDDHPLSPNVVEDVAPKKPNIKTSINVKTGVKAMSYMKFRIPGFSSPKEAVFVPEDVTIDSTLMRQLTRLVKLPDANLIIQMWGSEVSPDNILPDESPGTKTLNSLRSDLKERGDVDGTLNAIVEKKCYAITMAVMSAIEQTGSMSYSCNTTNFLEHLMSTAIKKNSRKIQSLAAMHLHEGPGGKPIKHPLAKKLREDLLKYANDPENQGITEETVANAKEQVWSGALWDPQHPAQTNEDFIFNGMMPYPKRNWEISNHPAGNWVWPDADFFFFFYTPNEDGEHKSQMKFDPSVMGPYGYVLASGLNEEFIPLFLDCCEFGRPTVLLQNTGGAAFVAATFLDLITRVLHDDPQVMKDLAREGAQVRPGLSVPHRVDHLSPTKILASLEQACGTQLEEFQKHNRMFNLSQVIHILDSVKIRPKVFTDTIKAIDVLQESPEDVLEKISSCFSSTYTGLVELGASGAQTKVTMEAWKAHQALENKASAVLGRSTRVYFAAAWLTFFSTVLAQLLDVVQQCRSSVVSQSSGHSMACDVARIAEIPDHMLNQVLHYWKVLIIIIPLLGGLAVTLTSYFKFQQRHALLKSAAANIVQHIFLFRACAGPYSMQTSSTAIEMTENENPGEAEEVSQGALQHMLRMKFVMKINELVRSVTVSSAESDPIDLPSAQQPISDIELHQHVMSTCYSLHPFCPRLLGGCSLCGCCARRRRRRHLGFSVHASSPHGPHVDVSVAGEVDEDIYDWVSPITAEMYFDTRVEMLIPLYFQDAQRLVVWQNFHQVSLFICGVAASLLAAFDASVWIPVIMAVAALVSASLNFHPMESHILAMSQARSALHALQITWTALSNMDRRTPKQKAKMVLETEELAMQVVRASLGGASLADRQGDEADANAKQDSSTEKTKKDKEQRGPKKRA